MLAKKLRKMDNLQWVDSMKILTVNTGALFHQILLKSRGSGGKGQSIDDIIRYLHHKTQKNPDDDVTRPKISDDR